MNGRRRTPGEHPEQQVLITPPAAVDLAGGHRLWTHLAALLAPPPSRSPWPRPGGHIGFEYAWSTAGVQISLLIPPGLDPAAAAKAVEAAWPGAHTYIADAVPAIPAETPADTGTGTEMEAATVRGRLRLARHEALPLRTDYDTDPLRPLFTAAHPSSDGWQVSVQILARPAGVSRQARAVSAAALLQRGKPLPAIGRLLDPLVPKSGRQPPERPAQLKAVLDKATHPRFETTITYTVTGPADMADVCDTARSVAAAFAAFTGPHNRLRPAAHRRRGGAFSGGDVLSVPELAALAHLPIDPAIPGLVRAGARPIPAPSQIPQPGPGRKPLGMSETGVIRPLALPVAGTRHHVHVTGATGCGKTTLLTHWILADVADGRGVVVIDGKGDQVNDILDRFPLDAATRLTLIDPAVDGPPPGVNVLAGPDPHLSVDHVVAIFRQLYADSWGPRTDDILRAACLTLAVGARDPAGAATLGDVPRLLADPAWRQRLVARVSDPVLGEFWAWYDQLSKQGRAAAIGPVLNKLRALLLRPFVRAVIAQPATGIDLGAVLDGGILLVRIPKGELGSDTVRLLGSFLLSTLWEYAGHRSRIGEHARRDAAVYVDEVHNYLGLLDGVEDLLAEARAFRLSLVLAHQDLAQLPRDVRETVSANARNKIFFTVSPEDARSLERHVAPALAGQDLTGLGAFQAVCRPIIGDGPAPAFTLRTQPLPAPVPGRAAALRAAARRDPAVRPEPPEEGREDDAPVIPPAAPR